MVEPLTLLWESIPSVLLAFLLPAILLAVTIHFVSDNRRKNIHERDSYNIFLNSCLFSFAFLITYLFIVFVSTLLIPSANLELGTFNLILWAVIIGYVLFTRLIGEKLDKNRLYFFLIYGLDSIFIIGFGLTVAFIISAFIRSWMGLLPTYLPVVTNGTPLIVFITIDFVAYLFTKFWAIPTYFTRNNVSLIPFFDIPKEWEAHAQKIIAICSLVLISCFFLAVWQINSAYNRNLVNEEVLMSGSFYAPTINNLTMTRNYIINITSTGVSKDIPLETISSDEKPSEGAVVLGLLNLYWIDKDNFTNHGLELKTAKTVSIDSYLSYARPLTENDDDSVIAYLSFNFTGKKIRSGNLFFDNTGSVCYNISFNTTAKYEGETSKNRFDFYSYNYSNEFRIMYDNQTNSTYFGFDVSVPENISFKIICNKSVPDNILR